MCRAGFTPPIINAADGGDELHPAKLAMRNRGFCIFCYVLVAGVTFVMLRIEWLNIDACGRLPSREYINNDPAQRPVRWRYSTLTTEARWREIRGRSLGVGDRPLTPAERAEMAADIQRAQANNSLLQIVRTAGLVQYLLAPILIVFSIAIIGAKGLRFGVLPLTAGIAASVMMFWRAYLTSLG